MALNPVKRSSISEQVFEQMKEQIAAKEWLPGEKLPSEAELGNIFGVSRVTIRQALQKLAVLGLIETRFGEGSFVKEADLSQHMKTALAPGAYLMPNNTMDALEFRFVLEVETAGLAARRATDEDVEALREILRRQKDVLTRTAESFADDDIEFHMTIARITGNSLIVATYELVWDVLKNAMKQTVNSLGLDIGLPYHENLIDAIAAHDEHRAIVTMKAHMDTTREAFEQVTQENKA